MYLSLNWLKDFVDIPKSVTPEELAEKLTLHTVEVDGVEKQADKFNNVVVGEVLEVNPHPNADRLRLVRVNIGKEEKRIVCGAPNVEVGQLVPVALSGAILPNGMEMKETEIRGEKSEGMICAEDELGLGDGHEGIMVLNKNAKVGKSLASYLGMDDVIIELDNKSITHRPDLWSHYGIARELSVLYGKKLKKSFDDVFSVFNIGKKSDYKISVKVEDKEGCPRYMGAQISGIKIGGSPEWLSRYLIAAGMRPINNIVDITNYVMLELGQPLHAFDQTKINGKKIIVRKAKRGEIMETLDGQKRELDDTMIVIADNENPIGIAGIMGGQTSEIDNKTTSIFLEAANFDFVTIRKTAQKLGLRTEASIRFEKSPSPENCALALKRAINLIIQLCPDAELSSEIIDIKNYKEQKREVKVEIDWLKKMIGADIEEKQIVNTLESLGFSVSMNGNNLLAGVPSWRVAKDVSIAEDILEEVARIYGYGNIVPVLPSVQIFSPRFDFIRSARREVRRLLAFGCGLTETYNYSFVGEDEIKKLGGDINSYLRLLNPIASQYTLLKTSLAPNLIANAVLNSPRYSEEGLFEFGSIFLPIDGTENKDDFSGEHLPYQEERLGFVLWGSNAEVLWSRAKGVVEYLFDHWNMEATFTASESGLSWADDKYKCDIMSGKESLGKIALVSKKASDNIKLKKHAVITEISFKKFAEIAERSEIKFHEFEKFPPAVRDLAFVVDSRISYQEIINEIKAFSDLINKVELFDSYQGEKLGRGKKSLAFHITYLADRTLTGVEVDELQTGLINHLEEKFEAKVRNF